MRRIFYKALPYSKEAVTLALESGVDGLIVPDDKVAAAAGLARGTVLGQGETVFITLAGKKDEERAAALAAQSSAAFAAGSVAALAAGDSAALSVESNVAQGVAGAGPRLVVLTRGWEIIPVENLLASTPTIAVEAGGLEEAVLAAGVLERGVDTIVVTSEGLPELKAIVAALKYSPPALPLLPAVITKITPAGMGHRVCVDTTSLLQSGQGMLVGNSAAFTFLVNAETERNEYVAARPFRINAGGVHAYALMPHDRTAYLEELSAGSEVLIVAHTGAATLATVGRVKTERRPMLLVEAKIEVLPGGGGFGEKGGFGEGALAGEKSASGEKGVPVEKGTSGKKVSPAEKAAAGKTIHGAVFLQNAETIRLVTPDGTPVSVVDLKEGDTVLCRADVAGRHFGMRITEEIKES